jgi:hypothetical protein
LVVSPYDHFYKIRELLETPTSDRGAHGTFALIEPVRKNRTAGGWRVQAGGIANEDEGRRSLAQLNL